MGANGKKLDRPVITRLTCLLDSEATELLPGDVIVGEGMIIEPFGATNPGGFDYEEYLSSRGKELLVYPNEIFFN